MPTTLDSSPRLDNHWWQAVEGNVMDLGGWLRSLGLGQYEAAFRENAIDETVLRISQRITFASLVFHLALA
jgi:hypothetical protein